MTQPLPTPPSGDHHVTDTRGGRGLVPWMAIAALAMTAAWFAQLHLTTQSETRLVRDQLAIIEVALQSVRQELEAERILAQWHAGQLAAKLDGASPAISILSPVSDDAPGALAVAVWDPARQEGLLRVDRLPAPGAEADYQLWLADPGYPDPVDAGVITVDPQSGGASLRFTTRQPVHAVSSFAVTRERKSGTQKPAGPVVLSGHLSF